MTKPTFKHAGEEPANIRVRILNNTSKPNVVDANTKDFSKLRFTSNGFQSRAYREFESIDKSNGMEFINQEVPSPSVTLNRSGIVYIPMEKEYRSQNVCVFFDMLDYLAYQTLQKNGFVKLPSDCDAIIMMNVRNFIHLAIEGDDYNKVYLYFPNDVIGKTITQTLKERYGYHAIICNPLYKGYDNLLQFVQAIELTTNSN
ncbi:MAG: hypothetical protein SO013_06145 [Prevotella sp.]|nr:hypothetical protein [Prevotella sp.]